MKCPLNSTCSDLLKRGSGRYHEVQSCLHFIVHGCECLCWLRTLRTHCVTLWHKHQSSELRNSLSCFCRSKIRQIKAAVNTGLRFWCSDPPSPSELSGSSGNSAGFQMILIRQDTNKTRKDGPGLSFYKNRSDRRLSANQTQVHQRMQTEVPEGLREPRS